MALLLRKSIFAVALVAVLTGTAVQADEPRDHDRARRALEAGEVMPLSRILDRVERDYPGRVLEVELDREDERWLYEIKLLQDGGRVLKLKIDARDASLLEAKGRHADERGSR